MGVVLTNYQDSPPFPAMAVRDRMDYHAARADAQGTGVISGMQVTQNTGTGTDMTFNVSAGTCSILGAPITYAGATGLGPIGAASAGDRRDIVVYRNGTGIVVIPGVVPTLLQAGGSGSGLVGAWTFASTYVPPVKTNIVGTTDIILAEVYVAFNTTVIVTATNIIDLTNTLQFDSLTVAATGPVLRKFYR